MIYTGVMRVSIIAAIDEKRGLGKNNDLLFKIPEDMKRLREITTGHPLVMGRKTFESLGRLLPNRTHIVITRDSQRIEKLPYHPEAVVTSLEDGIEIAKKSDGSEEIFIFGGGEIFNQAIEKGLADRLYLTIVEGDYGADVFFPEYPEFTKVVSEEKKEVDKYKYKFLILERN